MRFFAQLSTGQVSLFPSLFSLGLQLSPQVSTVDQRTAVAQDLGQQTWIAPRGLQRYELYIGWKAILKPPAQRLQRAWV
jgi:hypothetical protein